MKVFAPFFKVVEDYWDSDKIYNLNDIKVVKVEPQITACFYKIKIADLIFTTTDGLKYTKMIHVILQTYSLTREYLLDLGFEIDNYSIVILR